MKMLTGFSLCLAGLLSGCGGGDPAASFDGSIEDRVAFVAKGSNALLSATLDDSQVRFVEATADNRTLVLHLDTDLDGSADGSSEELSKLFRPQVCANRGFRGLIAKGAAIRFEITRSKRGDRLEPFTISYCG